MTKLISIVVCGLLLASPVFAGGFVSQDITTVSLANAAIDTVVVKLADIRVLDNSGTAVVHFALSNLETGAADSCQVGIDIGTSLDTYSSNGAKGGGAWDQLYAVGLAGGKLDPGSTNKWDLGVVQGDYIRLRIQNKSGGAEIFSLRAHWLKD